jgi:hypothetical protein
MKMLMKTLIATMVGAALVSGSALAQSEPNPTDGRSGGTGVPSAVSGATPSTASDTPRYESKRPWYQAWTRKDSESRVTAYSLTDGRSGGVGVPSAVNGAVPSTSPAADLERLKSGDHASVSNGFPERHSLLEPNRYAQ